MESRVRYYIITALHDRPVFVSADEEQAAVFDSSQEALVQGVWLHCDWVRRFADCGDGIRMISTVSLKEFEDYVREVGYVTLSGSTGKLTMDDGVNCFVGRNLPECLAKAKEEQILPPGLDADSLTAGEDDFGNFGEGE